LVATTVRAWRPYAGPVALLLGVTVAIGLGRSGLHHHRAAAPPVHHAAKKTQPAPKHKAYYAVHAGDTLSAIATKEHVTLAALRRLNPNVQPTALFLGEKLRIR
jgi:LysM repeat protein